MNTVVPTFSDANLNILVAYFESRFNELKNESQNEFNRIHGRLDDHDKKLAMLIETAGETMEILTHEKELARIHRKDFFRLEKRVTVLEAK